MTNFDVFLRNPQFIFFAEPAAGAELLCAADPVACVLKSRLALERAVKWVYSVDSALERPWDDSLGVLMCSAGFRNLVDEDLWRRIDLIRKKGENATKRTVSPDVAALCLENLFWFFDFLDCCYAPTRSSVREFDRKRLFSHTGETFRETPGADEVDLADLIARNGEVRAEFTARRQAQRDYYVRKPLECTEAETRKIYIDTMLSDAGWVRGKNWIDEYEVPDMPNRSEVGYVDYALFGDDGRVLAIIEAKRTCVDVSKGRQQAKLYADLIERKQGRRPVVFLSNGFDTRIADGRYPERRVAAVYSKRDLEKWFNLQRARGDLGDVSVDKRIAGRYYQAAAVKAVCDAFGRENRRKALLVMATGSGKTRTVIALCKALLEKGWAKNILFLADRYALVTQAKRSFANLLPDLSATNLCEEKGDFQAHCVFSTYQTMMNCIDTARDAEGKLFSCGHFDLVVCDEAHRSIYNKYRDIFGYFDAPLVGLTATPKDEIDKNTYSLFELQNGVPTYGYELADAVRDGYLVDFVSVETTLKFIQEGIVYDDLSDEDKEAYEETFGGEDGDLPEKIAASEINEHIFNEDTIRKVLRTLMEKGLKIDYGNRIGKTIIFAKNHRHAEKIFETFGKEYPRLVDFAKVIDNYTNYAQSAIDEFSDPKKLPQIAISVDMLDTGIDVPEVLNLVFFKKVLSKAKFWQMIGRGTRLCPGLVDGKDKEKFYIFDFCGNFEFFRIGKGKEASGTTSLQSGLFGLKAEIAYKLQDLRFQDEPLKALRAELVEFLSGKTRELDRSNFAVRQHLKSVERYADPASYAALTYEDVLALKDEVAPLVYPDQDPDDVGAQRFDALLYQMELALLAEKNFGRARADLVKKAAALSRIGNIPAIQAQGGLIDEILHTDYLDRAGVVDFEHVRESLRDLIRFIPPSETVYDTDFSDDILSLELREAELSGDDLRNYRAKAEYYVRRHQDNTAIAKLKGNVPLTPADVKMLEEILWSEVGTQREYRAECGDKPLGEFVREIVGLDMNAAKAAFSEFLDGARLDSRQIYFVNQIVEYIVCNGMMKDLSVLQGAPFTNQGSIVEIFEDDHSLWMKIKKAIDRVNANAAA